MRRFVTLVSAYCLLGLANVGSPARAADLGVDLELVLAVDVSRSMDFDEQRLQREGYVAAFRHPDVIQAITSGGFGRIAVMYLEWARPGFAVVGVRWTLIANQKDADDFAAKLAAASRSSESGTSISSGLLVAAGMFARNSFEGARQTIDVSGDGPNNAGYPVDQTRDLLINRGLTINGLPIMLKPPLPFDGYDIPNLDAYYKDCVIGGPGAFVVSVVDAHQFEAAIRRKLVMEIAGRAPLLIEVAASAATRPHADCQIGEKARRRQFFPDR